MIKKFIKWIFDVDIQKEIDLKFDLFLKNVGEIGEARLEEHYKNHNDLSEMIKEKYNARIAEFEKKVIAHCVMITESEVNAIIDKVNTEKFINGIVTRINQLQLGNKNGQ